MYIVHSIAGTPKCKCQNSPYHDRIAICKIFGQECLHFKFLKYTLQPEDGPNWLPKHCQNNKKNTLKSDYFKTSHLPWLDNFVLPAGWTFHQNKLFYTNNLHQYGKIGF